MEEETSSTRERASSLLGRSGEAKITLFSADARAGVYYKLHVTCSATRRSLEGKCAGHARAPAGLRCGSNRSEGWGGS